MSVHVWRIAVELPDCGAADLSGAASSRSGGRWNAVDTPVLYCAETIALAQLEVMGRLYFGSLVLPRFVVRVDIPDPVWARREVLSPVPLGWDALPYAAPSVDAGERWIVERRSAVLVVPSVIVPEEHNILINPAHPDAAAVQATVVRRWLPVHFPFLAGDSQ